MIGVGHTSLALPGILVVDDEEIMRNLLHDLLAEGERIVHTAADAAEARRILQQEAMDVIVCDHDMPGEDGLSLLTELRGSHPNLRRILTTGHAPHNLALRGINDAKLMCYLPKPIHPQLLLDTVSEALRLAEKDHEHTNSEHRFTQFIQRGSAALVHFTTIGIISFFALAMTATILFVLLYLCKWMLGIDLLPTIHLGDLL